MRHRPRGNTALALCALLAIGTACAADEEPAPLPRDADAAPSGPVSGTSSPASAPARGMAWVIFDADTVHAEIAYTEQERAQGLMFREELAEGSGMIFVFDDVDARAFWMKDTYVPLDIAYMDESRRIVDIQQMTPETTDTYPSAAPAMFALEVPQGWFEARGIEVGDMATIIFGRF